MRRRRRRRTAGQTPTLIDRDEKFILRRSALYLGRILERFPEVNQPTLEFLFWVLGDQASATWEPLAARLSDEGRERFEDEIRERDDLDDAARIVVRYLNRAPRSLTSAFVKRARAALRKRTAKLRLRGTSEPERALRRVRTILDLTELEAEYCFFIYIVGCWPRLENYFESHLECQRPPGKKYVAAALGVAPQDLTRAVQGKLNRLGMIEQQHNWLALSEDYLPLFQDSPRDLFAQGLFRRAPREVVPLGHHLVDPSVTEHLIALLSARPGEHGTHVLLYGPPGTGKSSYARGLARRLGVPAYEVVPGEDTRRVARRTAILACLNMTNHGDGSLVIVDEADKLLQTGVSFFGFQLDETQDKGWLNYLLERPGVRMIWVCNEIGGIDESVQRRFAFSLGFNRFGRRQRLQLWQTIAGAHRVRRMLRPDDVAALATEFKLGAGAIDMAVRSAKQTAGGSRPAFLDAVRGTLEAHRTLLNGGQRVVDRDRVAGSFRREALSTDADLDAVQRRLEAADRALRDPGRAAGPGGLNLLFFGPPGTGKSELARHIAHGLDREAIVRRPSDVRSKWVGETEQNIARAFAEAEGEDAVLILDEVDTFLYGREMAQHSWEVSFTNELLTRMERFRGNLICTTNRLEGLDPAALRRFQVKVRFDYLTSSGKLLLYEALLAPLCPEPLGAEQRRVLEAIGPLAPGDFRVVRDRWATERPGHAELLRDLEAEAALRIAQRGGRTAGFGRG